MVESFALRAVEATMNGILLDTTVLIDLLRGDERASNFIDTTRDSDTPIAISVISAMELVAGCRNNHEVAAVKALVTDFDLVHTYSAISAEAYNLMLRFSKSHGLTIPDALIAATAIVQEFELVSDNIRHFRMIPTLVVSRPY